MTHSPRGSEFLLRLAWAAIALLGVVACSGKATCPEGYAQEDDVCVAIGSGSDGSGAGGSACGSCPTETPVCDVESATCVACLGEEGCAGDTPVCLAGDTPSENQCVACTAEAQETCGEGTCNVLENTCTDVALASRGMCEVCRGSAQCQEGMACVQTEMESIEAAYVCQYLKSSRGDDCPRYATPFAVVKTFMTAEGGEAEVCAFCVGVSGSFD